MPAVFSRPGACALTLTLLLAGCAGGPEEQASAPTAQATPSEAAPAVEAAPDDGAPAAEAAPDDGAPSSAAAPAEGLGLTRERLIEVLAEQDLDAAAFEPTTFEDGREVVTASFPGGSQRQVLWIAMFGGESDPHTVRLDYYPNNARGGESETVQEALDRLLVALFPNWADAPQWPEFAGARAWQETAKIMQDETAERRIPVLETERDGVWLAALGVPPDVVNYVVTTNPACRPSRGSDFYKGYAACR